MNHHKPIGTDKQVQIMSHVRPTITARRIHLFTFFKAEVSKYIIRLRAQWVVYYGHEVISCK